MKTAKISSSALSALVPVLILTSALMQVGCGGGSSTSTPGNPPIATPGNNVAAMTVNAGPPELQSLGGTVNTGFIDVKICAPGTSTCQTVNFVSVDTGSVGFRILASKLTLTLPTQKDSSGNTIAECNQFLDGFTWGPVQTADISIVGTNEQATSVPIQIVNDNNSFTGPPSSCSSGSFGDDNNIQGFGAYAILGIGHFRQDCGLGCAQPVGSQFNPGLYYACASGTCNQTSVSIAQQLQNPVALFQTDNNGTVIELPHIPPQGAATATGSVVFGIGTQSNNALGSATKLMLDGSATFTTTFGPAKNSFTGSFIDSGSNGIYFLDTSMNGIPTCPAPNNSFYCPTSTQTLSATNQGTNSVSSTVTFNVANANSLSGAFSAFNDLSGINNNPPAFDFGLPFFFGRNVFTGLESVSNGQPTDTGQFVAY